MSDAQNVPVYMRDVDEAESRFLGRFFFGELEALTKEVSRWGCFNGDDVVMNAVGQFVCYEPEPGRTFCGFEIIVSRDDA